VKWAGHTTLAKASIAFWLTAHPAQAFAQTETKVSPMSQPDTASDGFAAPDAEVSEKLAEYDKSLAPAQLKEAADAAALHDGQMAPDPSLAEPLARQRIAGWLAILERLKRDLDPEFNPANPPVRRVTPPLTASGAQLPPGVSPDDIKDPKARQAYIAAIQQNAERIASYGRNAKLYQAHAVIIERAPPSIADAHNTLGMPIEDIETMITRADITNADREVLLAALH
jgi:hypothetical protein